MSTIRQTPDNFQLRIRTFNKASEEALLRFFAKGVPALLDSKGLRHHAGRIGVSTKELKRLLDDFARRGLIRYDTHPLLNKLIAIPVLDEEAI